MQSSTLSSAYLIARSRVHRKRSVSSVSQFDETSVIDSKRSDPFKACSLDLDGTLNIRVSTHFYFRLVRFVALLRKLI